MKSIAFLIALGCSFCAWTETALPADETIRSQAVIDLSFDEPEGDAVDEASAGRHKDRGKFVNGPARVNSPFWNQRGKRAVQFDAERKQYVQIAQSEDASRPDGATVSFFFLNLHPVDDKATRGVFAKRTNDGATNYGINYAQGDSIRPYINDGNGYRFPGFSKAGVIGERRLVYLTATFEATKAPADVDPNEGNDAVLIRLYVNGKPVKPTSAFGVTLKGNDAWATNVKVAQLVNNVPLTLGATNAAVEHASCLIDEFTLFDRALKPDEVAALFQEVAGENGGKLAAEELKPQNAPQPMVSALSLNGVQIGKSTQVAVFGRNLGNEPVLRLPLKGVKARVLKGSNAGRVMLELDVPGDAPPGYYPLRIQTADGLSNPVVLAVDQLPQHPTVESTPVNPSELPAAFSGTISGADRARVYFQGKSGQRIVADVETRRLGTEVDPVLEIKTKQGTPLIISWGQVALKGDARAETTLPADGLYFVELHDLAFKAPGRSAFRLKVGDLKLVDRWFPPAVPRGENVTVRPVGTGFEPNDKAEVSAKGATADRIAVKSDASSTTGPQPAMTVSDAREYVEPQEPGKKPDAIDARFDSGNRRALFLNGLLAKEREVDRYVLDVEPGAKLRLQFLGRAIDSPINGEITVRALPQKNVLARVDDDGSARDPKFEVAVPANAKQLEVAVGDLHGRGGPPFTYRLRVVPAANPEFAIAVNAAQLNIPAGGSGFLELQVSRDGYDGPIRLSVEGRDDLTVQPEQIPPRRRGRVFVTVQHRGADAGEGFQHVQLVGASVGTNPVVQRTARLSSAASTVAGWETDLPMTIGSSAPFSVEVAKPAPALFKGGISPLEMKVQRTEPLAGYAVRLSLVSTERPRRIDPRKPQDGNKPLVRSVPGQSIPPGESSGPLNVDVPLDVAQKQIEFVVRAELVPHAYSGRVVATAYSRPFRLPVRNALTLDVDDASLKLTGGRPGVVRGELKRSKGFREPVVVAIEGLPQGYETKPVTVPGDSSAFEIPVTPAAETNARTLPKISLTVSLSGKRALLPPRTVTLRVSPPESPSP